MLHSFTPNEAKWKLYFLRLEKEAGICYLTPSPPKLGLSSLVAAKRFGYLIWELA